MKCVSGYDKLNIVWVSVYVEGRERETLSIAHKKFYSFKYYKYNENQFC